MSDPSLPLGRFCTLCKEWKTLQQFGKNPYGRFGRNTQCKKCVNERYARCAAARPFLPTLTQQKCNTCHAVKFISEFARHASSKTGYKSRCKVCYRVLYGVKAKQYNAAQAKKSRELRLQILKVYSPDGPCCACCGESILEFLAIDHIDGKGSEHRRQLGVRGGYKFYKWIVDNNYPPGFRILCHNCNFTRGIYGYCPHER